MSSLISHLFKTNSIKMCPENKPFWYTSGKIGPYYINTEYLYGSEQDAKYLLSFIETEKTDIFNLPTKLFAKILKQYETNLIYKDVINQMKDFICNNIDVNSIDYISGGERRDWFFSFMIAKLLGKPHITIYKDLKLILSTRDFSSNTQISDLNNAKVLHVADLITEASSYIRAWIPAIESINAKITWSISVIDRLQGGTQKLLDSNISAYSMVKIEPDVFSQALSMGVINKSQFNMLNQFISEPDLTMKNFLIEHPEFLKDALKSDSKTAQRAKLCIDNNLYNLG